MAQHKAGAGGKIKLPILQQLRRKVHALRKKGFEFRQHRGAGIHQRFARHIPAEFIHQRILAAVRRKIREMHFARGNIRKAQPGAIFAHADAGEVIVARFIEHAVFDHRAGRDHADHIPLHYALGERWILHLLADGHLIALGD